MSRLARKVSIGGKSVDVPVNIIDDLVNFVSPSRGQERFQSRLRMAIGGGYSGADRSRSANRYGSTTRERDANSVIVPDLAILREESQHLIRNNAIAGGAVRTNVSKVVGTGLKVKPQIDLDILGLTPEEADAWQMKASREFRLATETREIDIERQLPFSLLQGLVFLKTLEDGDLLVNMPRFARPGSPYTLKLQLIEAARLQNKDAAPNTNKLTAGVEKDDNGAPVAYHVLKQHPGAVYRKNNQLEWETLPAFSSTGSPLCLFLLDKTRPGQSRGVPYLTPVVELIKQLGRYTDAEVMAAVVSGMITAFITTEGADPEGVLPTNENPIDADDTSLELGYGTVVGLEPGEKVDTVNPGRPNPAFDPFMTAILRQIGMALELPFEVLIKHFTASYSASRAALMEAWDYFRRRRHWLVTMFCQPVYEAIITEAVARGRLAAPGFLSDPLIRKAWLGTVWSGDAPYHLDPLKEINAAKERMASFLTTHDEECAAMPQGGADWMAKVPQFIKEKQIIDELSPEPVAAITPEKNAPPEPASDLETT